jgi:hypothetical protein
MTSPEHKAIAAAIDGAIQSMEASALVGVFESQRKMFDYGCLLKRDLTRPLVAQVLWGHEDGLEKDLRTLLFDAESTIKLYVLKDATRIRATLDDVLSSYRNEPEMRKRLVGLKLLFVPPDFDADSERQLAWLQRFLQAHFSKDMGFNILFGGLTRQVFDTFMGHNGPFGLKYAVLHEIVQNGLVHTPTFKERIGYKTTGPIREVLAMLNAAGLVRNWPRSVCYFPTIRGRFVLDFTRRVLLDATQMTEWSAETEALFEALNTKVPVFRKLDSVKADGSAMDLFSANLLHAKGCKSNFGRDLLAGVNTTAPELYSEFVVNGLIAEMKGRDGFTFESFAEPDYLFFPKS